jgi:hypothetical protein
MKKLVFYFPIGLFVFSCKTQPDASRHYADGNEKKVYKLALRPEKGAKYYYDTYNESEVKMEVGGRKVDNVNRASTGISFVMDRDSAGDLLLNMTYDKVHLYTKENDEVTELDAANAATSGDPVERMLGAMIASPIQAVMNPRGELRSMSGYREMTEKLVASLNTRDESVRNLARARLEKTVGGQLVRKNMDQLFHIFPDSAVHIGDRWKLSYTETTDLSLKVNSTFILNKIEDGTAYVSCHGDITGDSTASNLMGPHATASLKGSQEGEYEMDAHTGMLLGAHLSAEVEGALNVMGRDIPLTLEMKVKMNGQRVK